VKEEQIDKGIEQIPAPETAQVPDTKERAASNTPTEPESQYPWAVPEGWVLDETPRQMRIATYMAPTPGGSQEVAVTRFPRRVGGELANINRWRGQMGLAPIGEPELEDNIERFTAGGFDGYQVRIESERGVMLAAGIFDSSIGQTWFVRATTDDPGVADAIEDDVFAMARSIAE
jgi:hypothetical protein